MVSFSEFGFALHLAAIISHAVSIVNKVPSSSAIISTQARPLSPNPMRRIRMSTTIRIAAEIRCLMNMEKDPLPLK